MKALPALLLCLLPLIAHAVEPGEHIAPWTLHDQHDQTYTLGTDTRILLVAHDMDGGKLLKAALAEQQPGYLEAREAVFVADIQRMPALISKLFAVPAMRDYNYRVMLDRDGQVAGRYPAPEGQVLWLQLEQGTVQSQQVFATAEALQAALAQAPRR